MRRILEITPNRFMKLKVAFAVLCSLTILAVVGLAFVGKAHRSEVRKFDVSGQIRSIDSVAKTVRISHDEIPGYMPAMTMSLPVKGQAVLKNLAPEQRVRFQLIVTRDDSWISRIEPVSPGPTVDSAAATPTGTSLDREANRVQKGELLPDFKLVDQDNHPVQLSDFRGKAVIVTFIYTRCPLPNFCPLMSKNFQALQERLNKSFPSRYQLLSISIDPQFDRPAVLKEYGSRYGANERHWTFATGTAEEINSVAEMFGLFYQEENGLIAHDLRTALIGPDGQLVHLWKSNIWTPYEVERMVRECLTASNEFASRPTKVR
jgi:protein SCO1/2